MSLEAGEHVAATIVGASNAWIQMWSGWGLLVGFGDRHGSTATLRLRLAGHGAPRVRIPFIARSRAAESKDREEPLECSQHLSDRSRTTQ